MRNLLILAVCVLLVSCDYTVPLIETPQLAIDPLMVGLWERTKADNQTERLLVLPLDAQQYMIAYPQGTSDVTMYARAYRVEVEGKRLIQIVWIGNASGNAPDDDRVYQVASYTIDREELTVSMLNTALIDKDVTTSAELISAIEQNIEDPNLFTDLMIFRRITNQ
jgi:hypothetical protein